MGPNAERSTENGEENEGEEESEERSGPQAGQTTPEKQAHDPMDTEVSIQFERLWAGKLYQNDHPANKTRNLKC